MRNHGETINFRVLTLGPFPFKCLKSRRFSADLTPFLTPARGSACREVTIGLVESQDFIHAVVSEKFTIYHLVMTNIAMV